jgi:pimeloyl-ACP methyl ester carboxylesterase
MPVQNPVIVLPGITGSTLRDRYRVEPETVWSVLRRDELRVALHPDDQRYELIEPALLEADAMFRVVYGDLVEELRAELSAPGRITPVYPFAYDWRLPLDAIVQRFEAFVDEVAARTALLRHYHRAGYEEAPRVDVVAHSMGGLIVAGYLSRTGNKSKIARVVTIATPFRGSLEAPIKVVTGTAEIGEVESNPRDRFAARLTPALYHLLPDFAGAVIAEGDIPPDLFDPDAWQPSVTGSIAEALQLYGKDPAPARADRLLAARALLQQMLDDARRFRARLESFDPARAGLRADGWLCIVGVDDTTRVRLPIRSVRGEPVFDLRSADRVNRWSDPDEGQRVLTGDGTVPFAGAQCGFIPTEKIVCLRPRDFGYWEIRDRLMREFGGFHGSLPTMNLVHRLAAAFLLNEPRRKGIGAWRPPGISPGEWEPPIRGLPDRARQ